MDDADYEWLMIDTSHVKIHPHAAGAQGGNEAIGLTKGAEIPPKSNSGEQREFDRHLYKVRQLVENAFLELKQWRGIATRYAKRNSPYLAAVHFG